MFPLDIYYLADSSGSLSGKTLAYSSIFLVDKTGLRTVDSWRLTERQSVFEVQLVKGSPRTKGRKERIAEIAVAAKGVFFKKGYFDSTIDEIARRAGISKGTIYLYFNNKDELYVSLMLPLIQEFTDMLREFENEVLNKKHRTGASIIAEFCRTYIKLYDSDPEGLRVFQVFQLLDLFKVIDKRVLENLRTIAKGNIARSANIISLGMDQGLLPRMNPVQFVNILWASFLGIIQVEGARFRATQKDFVIETVNACFSLFINAVDITR